MDLQLAHSNPFPTSSCTYACIIQCGPCRAFTPELVKFYKKIKGDSKKFEIIFVSSDREEDSMKEYFDSMPWLAVPYGDDRKKALSRTFKISGEFEMWLQ